MLDRAMANNQLSRFYHTSIIENFSTRGSDHGHILIDTNTRIFFTSNHFRFEAKFLLEDNFVDLLKLEWSIFIKGSFAFQLIRKTNLFKKRN